MTQNKNLVIGVSGPIASGKSTVSGYLRDRYNAYFIDADKVGHEVLRFDEVKKSIRGYFGDGVFDDAGEVIRAKLGEVVFNDEAKLKKLSEITHPVIIGVVKEEIAKGGVDHQLCVIEAIGLYETELKDLADECWSVTAPVLCRVRRIMKSRGQSFKTAVSRIKSQKNSAFYEKNADVVFVSTGGCEKIYRQVDRELGRLIKEKG